MQTVAQWKQQKLCDHPKLALKKSNEMQKYENIYLLLNYSTCFGRPSRPSPGAHKIVVAASGTDHTVKYKSWTRSLLLVQLLYFTVRSVPEAATTVLCAPDDGRDGRPKHVE